MKVKDFLAGIGVSWAALSRWENKQRAINPMNRKRILALFSCSFDDIFYLDE